jgi:hypothetical protein
MLTFMDICIRALTEDAEEISLFRSKHKAKTRFFETVQLSVFFGCFRSIPVVLEDAVLMSRLENKFAAL